MKEVFNYAGYSENILWVMAQAFYGNRTLTQTTEEDMDGLILGWLIPLPKDFDEPIDRTIIRLPGAEHLVLVYNKYQEEKRIQGWKEWPDHQEIELKPLAYIPEMDLKIYSRCLGLRMNEEGKFASVEEEDIETLVKYLAS